MVVRFDMRERSNKQPRGLTMLDIILYVLLGLAGLYLLLAIIGSEIGY